VADTLPAIAKFFGVDQNAIYTMNSWARAGIKPGDKLKIPPPTR
jgi:LysM repeat protein